MAGTYTNLIYHIIFSTKNRDNTIDNNIRPEMYRYLGGIVRGEGGILLEIGGNANHLHLLTKFKPAITISDLLRNLKAHSSKWLHEKSAYNQHFRWQDGYSVFSVSESQVQSIKKYIMNQEEHHRHKTFQEEYVGFLKKNHIEYDKRYIWD